MRSILLLLIVAELCSAQVRSKLDPTLVTLKHKYYTTVFSTQYRFPVAVKFWLTKKMLSCEKSVDRTDDFRPDPLLPDDTDLKSSYAKSGFDCGHNMDAASNSCDIEGMSESFFYSNMMPQTPRLNRGQWKTLEEQCRNLAREKDSVLVWCGAVPSRRKVGEITVPSYCWKIVYVKKTKETFAYSFKNDMQASKAIEEYRVPLDSVQYLSGIKFKTTFKGKSHG